MSHVESLKISAHLSEALGVSGDPMATPEDLWGQKWDGHGWTLSSGSVDAEVKKGRIPTNCGRTYILQWLHQWSWTVSCLLNDSLFMKKSFDIHLQ